MDPSLLSRWVVVIIEVVIIFGAFLLRWTNTKRDTSKWVHAQYRALQGKMSDSAAAAFKTMANPGLATKRHGHQSYRSQLRETRKRKERELKEVAILYGESRHMHMQLKKQKESEEAFARLKVLFPWTDDKILRSMIQMSPDEEVAVARLLTLGHPMWKVDDYKLLLYAVRRYRKEAKREAKRRGSSELASVAASRTPAPPASSGGASKPMNSPGRLITPAGKGSPMVQKKHSQVSFGDDLVDRRFGRD